MTCLQSLSTAKDLPPTCQDRCVSFFFLFSFIKLGSVNTGAFIRVKTIENGVYKINEISGA